MKKHWLTLYENTFLWLKKNTGLAYNAENKKQLVFPLYDKIEKICHHLLIKENLYSIELSDEVINDNEVSQWINSLVSIQAGYLTLNVEFEKRPVSLKPILKVQDKKEHFVEQHNLGFKGEILQYIHELTFYINGSEHGNNEYFKQSVFPVKKCRNLDSSKILFFIKYCMNPFLSNINLVGNIFLYPDFERFISDITDLSIPCTIHITVQDFINSIAQLKTDNWPEHVNFNILVNTVFDVALIKDCTLPYTITTFIFTENDYLEFSTLFDEIPNNHTIIYKPLYNKQNLRFFESSVFIDMDDLAAIDLSKNDIFMRQALNIIDFGKLTVMPDEKVYANVNEPPLGTINDSTYSIVYKEFTEGKSWFKIRDQSPCQDCMFQWLCPSPSNYETAIGQVNLCHVKQ